MASAFGLVSVSSFISRTCWNYCVYTHENQTDFVRGSFPKVPLLCRQEQGQSNTSPPPSLSAREMQPAAGWLTAVADRHLGEVKYRIKFSHSHVFVKWGRRAGDFWPRAHASLCWVTLKRVGWADIRVSDGNWTVALGCIFPTYNAHIL